MIDLHCHILPGIDDGAETVDDSAAMAKVALEDGVRTIVATPHGVEWAYTGDEVETRTRVADLGLELAARGLELEVLPGLEVFITPDTPAHHAQGRVYTMNGSRYMLVEFPLSVFPSYVEQILFELQLRQLVPVIAHPERNSTIAADPQRLLRLVERGMLVQVTAGSILGIFGARTRETAESLLTRRLAHVIASDAHSAGGRAPVLSAAMRRASELIGEEAARAMVTSVPAAILRNDVVELPRPQPPPRRFWFPFMRKK